jgi:hypothetical protein
LGIQDANNDLIPVSPPHLLDPHGQAEILRLDVLGILVDLLRVDLLSNPRSIQERLAVGSVVESGEDGGQHLDQHGRFGWHVFLSLLSLVEAGRAKT